MGYLENIPQENRSEKYKKMTEKFFDVQLALINTPDFPSDSEKIIFEELKKVAEKSEGLSEKEKLQLLDDINTWISNS
jgi:hypothetical protein